MEKDEKKTLSSRLNAWLTKYRVAVLSVVCLLVLAVVVFAVVYTIDTNNKKKGFDTLDELEYRYITVKKDNSMEEDVAAAKVAEILAETKAFAASKGNNSVGSRAYMLAADIDFTLKNYKDAKDSYLKAASANEKAYTAPLCWFNAAVCAENLGETDEAITLYEKANSRNDFVMKSRVLFSLGRLAEQKKDYTKAVEYYTNITDNYSSESWGDLARSRIIALEAEGLVQ